MVGELSVFPLLCDRVSAAHLLSLIRFPPSP